MKKKKKKKKKELPMCSKDLDNPTYGLFKKPGRYCCYHQLLLLILDMIVQVLLPC
jgi:hypothetical protein